MFSNTHAMSAFSQILKRFSSTNGACLRNYSVVFNVDKKGFLRPLFKVQVNRIQSCKASTNEKTVSTTGDSSQILVTEKTKMSKAMKMYLERAEKYDSFMKTELQEFEIGLRHLANMMGEDPETFTQEDADQAIEYLMPSGLYDSKARPIFQHPSKVFPKRKAAEFAIDGRPFHYLFYCGWPNYYQVLHDISKIMIELNNYEDSMISSGVLHPDISNKINLGGTRWLMKPEFEQSIIETIQDRDYDQFIACMIRLAQHPYSSKAKDFIMKFRVPLVSVTLAMDIPPLKYDENKRPYMNAAGYRKTSVASVTVRGNGTGKIDINGMDITFFDETQDREQLMFPLHFSGLLHKVDVEAMVIGVGRAANAGAIRLGISLALRSFVSQDMVERMRLAGLLMRDPRTKERKKPGQEGARKKFTWKKR